MKSNLLLLMACTAAVACARPLPPPGGEEDRLPPQLVGTVPEPLAVVPANDEPVVFRFDERISERNFSETLITVSPLDGALRIDRSGREVRIGIDGGWRADRVYRIVLLPGIRDLFGNTRTEAAELVFSTGPPVPDNALAGIVLDRVTARAAQNGVVTAVRRADSVTYMAVADTGGFFSLRHIPLGVYDVRAYSDQNRNRRRDSAEPVDSGRVTTLSSTSDTLAVIFNVLSPDSTRAEVTSAEVIDSLRIRVQLDDYVAPDAPTSQIAVQLVALPDSTPVSAASRVVTAAVWDSLRAVTAEAARAAAADSAAAAAAADSAAADVDTTAARPRPSGRPPARNTRQQEAQGPLPSRDLVIMLERPLAPGQYVVTLGGITNLSNISGGGGSASFEVRAAPARQERPAPADTTSVPPPR